MAGYRAILASPETGLFRGLTRELDLYWRVLEPVFEWSAEERAPPRLSLPAR